MISSAKSNPPSVQSSCTSSSNQREPELTSRRERLSVRFTLPLLSECQSIIAMVCKRLLLPSRQSIELDVLAAPPDPDESSLASTDDLHLVIVEPDRGRDGDVRPDGCGVFRGGVAGEEVDGEPRRRNGEKLGGAGEGEVGWEDGLTSERVSAEVGTANIARVSRKLHA
jgi:hypothetical protein